MRNKYRLSKMWINLIFSYIIDGDKIVFSPLCSENELFTITI